MASHPATGSEACTVLEFNQDSLVAGISSLNFEKIGDDQNYVQSGKVDFAEHACKMKMKWKELRTEDDRPPPPLSLANVMLEGPPTPLINSKTMKLKESRVEEDEVEEIKRATTITKVCINSLGGYFPWMKGREVCRELPYELWEDIGKRLSSRLDILRFRSVCKDWRSSLPSPTRFPLWVPPLPRSVDPDEVPCIITEVSVFYQTYFNDGYIVLEEVDQGGKFYTHRSYNYDCKVPVENRSAKIGNPAKSFTSQWSPWASPYDRLSFISKYHHLRSAIPRKEDPTQLDYCFRRLARKIAIVSSARDGVNPSYAKLSDLSIFALIHTGDMSGRLCLLRLRGSPESWAWDTDVCPRIFVDITSYKGRLCAIELDGSVVILDYDAPGSLKMTELTPPSHHISTMRRKYIYEDSEDLYLASWCVVKWEKYKLVFGETMMWVKVHPTVDTLFAQFISRGRVR